MYVSTVTEHGEGINLFSQACFHVWKLALFLTSYAGRRFCPRHSELLSVEALSSFHFPMCPNAESQNCRARWYLQSRALKYFDYVIPTHLKQAAYYCELDIFVKVTGKRPVRNEKGQINVSGLQIA